MSTLGPSRRDHAGHASGRRPSYLTVSVDDGHPADLRTAELLARFGLKATFYVPLGNPSRPVINDRELATLAEAFEIGGHSVSHRALTRMSAAEAWREIYEGKVRHEQVLGRPLVSFCYPKGKVNEAVKGLVEKAGFAGARTCRLNRVDAPHDPFLWGVTTQAYSHGPGVQLRHALLEGNLPGVWNYARIHQAATDWETHFRRGLDHVERRGGVAHLYLHSWEIEANHEWHKLERALADAAARPGLLRLTNGELFVAFGGSGATVDGGAAGRGRGSLDLAGP